MAWEIHNQQLSFKKKTIKYFNIYFMFLIVILYFIIVRAYKELLKSTLVRTILQPTNKKLIKGRFLLKKKNGKYNLFMIKLSVS